MSLLALICAGKTNLLSSVTVFKSIIKNLSDDLLAQCCYTQAKTEKQKIGSYPNVQHREEESRAVNTLENRVKTGWVLGGKDKFGMEHAEFEVLTRHQVVISSDRQKWKPDA